MVAWLIGKRVEARAFAEEALADYQSQTLNPRQKGVAEICMALAHALAGRSDEAVKLAREGYAWQWDHDRYTALDARSAMQWIFLILDRRDDAFALLRDQMTGITMSGPEMIRLDPFWRRVKDDPRFEEILKLAKPL
jgi:hypothetical protein